jgi:hypothetical protein
LPARCDLRVLTVTSDVSRVRTADGVALWHAVCEHELEGVVAKRRTGRYLPGRAGWVKVKNRDYWRYELEREGAIRSRQGSAGSTVKTESMPNSVSSLTSAGAISGMRSRHTALPRESQDAGGAWCRRIENVGPTLRPDPRSRRVPAAATANAQATFRRDDRADPSHSNSNVRTGGRANDRMTQPRHQGGFGCGNDRGLASACGQTAVWP